MNLPTPRLGASRPGPARAAAPGAASGTPIENVPTPPGPPQPDSGGPVRNSRSAWGRGSPGPRSSFGGTRASGSRSSVQKATVAQPLPDPLDGEPHQIYQILEELMKGEDFSVPSAGPPIERAHERIMMLAKLLVMVNDEYQKHRAFERFFQTTTGEQMDTYRSKLRLLIFRAKLRTTNLIDEGIDITAPACRQGKVSQAQGSPRARFLQIDEEVNIVKSLTVRLEALVQWLGCPVPSATSVGFTHPQNGTGDKTPMFARYDRV